jgi:hypothetical protein
VSAIIMTPGKKQLLGLDRRLRLALTVAKPEHMRGIGENIGFVSVEPKG